MLQKETIAFLKALKKNNNKAWFDANRVKFDAAKQNFEAVIQQVLSEFSNHEEEIANLTPKQCIFRQNRDVRFSNDKSPYKHHMGASIDRGGKKSGFAGYYFHCEPGNQSMIGGGLWMPEAGQLKKVRQEIDYCWDEFSTIISQKKFKTVYSDLAKGEYSLSREPKGYEKTNPAIEYLKLKSFIAIKPLSDDDLLLPDLEAIIVDSFLALKPFIRFINRALEDAV